MVKTNKSTDSTDEGAGTKALSTSSAEVVAANPDRMFFSCTNVAATAIDISLGFGEDAVDQQGIVLAQGETWEMPIGAVFTGAINAISASGTPSLAYVEW